MKRSLIPSMIFSILILTACLSPSGDVSAPTVTDATSAPSETPSPTPTEIPSPQSLLPQEVKEKFELAGVDLAQMQNAKYDKDGLHITLPGGEVIVLTSTDLQKGIYNGQDNVLQYKDETNQNVIYAFDKESGKWGVEVVKEYPICTPENFRDCEIPVEELFDGTYFHWLEKQAKTLACSPNMRTDVKMVAWYRNMIIPDPDTAPNFTKPGSEFFIRDHTTGFARYVLPDGQEVHYAVMPLFMCDLKDNTKLYPIVTVDSGYYPQRQDWLNSRMHLGVAQWQRDMRITPIVMGDALTSVGRVGLQDPLVARTFIENADMQDKFERFIAGDFSALSEPGIVVLTLTGDNKANKYK